jgi:Protein kinase domain
MKTCRSCNADLPESGYFCPQCGRALAADSQATSSLHVRDDGDESRAQRDTSSASLLYSSHHGHFLPGARIANRYRIVSLVGQGGMGEVYRADDLKLGHSVALKFLAKDLANDPRRLRYLHDEVRLARQISHPNVCRVHDIGEVDGQHFLSMEYIDGEDLRGLLRRIGRLPKDKGIEIAQQLCAGLSAAHEKGVLHRDLKPANIMLDGRGQVRITDYGLARSTSDGSRAGEVAGTPAYMAPEQLTRGATSIQSDLYSLGLVLYEVFTGRRVHKLGSIAELMQAHEESSVTLPSALSDDMDPAVERVILRCLEKEPRDRPKSARAVAAALPGGDPLVAALAAGETPSPGMVAAAGAVGEIPPAVAGACLSGVAIGLLVVSLLAQRTMLFNRAPLELPPDALEVKAKEIIKRLGYNGPPHYTARGFEDAPADREAIKQAELPAGVTDRWELLKTSRWPGARFWYRQSPEPMLVYEFWDEQGLYSRTRVDPQLPPWITPGMAGMRLDPRGKLRWFRAVPPARRPADPSRSQGAKLPLTRSVEPAVAADPSDLPWSTWFREEELGFNLEASSEKGRNPRKLSGDELREADWLRTPLDAYDHLAAWKGTWPDSDAPLYVEAATYRGRPVYFEILPPSFAEAKETSSAPGPAINSAFVILGTTLNFSLLVGQLLLAWRNLRLGRGDRRGALRLAQYIFLISLLAWVFRASHVGGLLEWTIFVIGLAQALLPAVLLWLSYIALEPFVRRLWPQTLISWARLLSGRFRDPRVGRDILLGALLGVFVRILIESGRWVPAWFGLQPGMEVMPLFSMDSTASLIGAVLELQWSAIGHSLMFLLLLLLLKLVLRSVWLAACAFVPVATAYFCLPDPESTYATWICIGLTVALFAWIVVRFGLLATVTGLAVLNLLTAVPITTDSSAFHFGNGLLVMGLVFALALYGSFKSLGGRPLFSDA